ncbi:CoA transferase [Agromyces sp. SYSU T00194]|uniref:CoA transferase n=1 Tax=Agromyces chitinivorans TaxID=3158560 RepID=UPI003390999E
MSGAPAAVPSPEPGRALAGLRVLDLAGEPGAYASRLLADLGAEVLRLEIAADADDPGVRDHWLAAYDAFTNAGKRRTVFADPERLRAQVRAVAPEADVLIEEVGADGAPRWTAGMAEVRDADLVHVVLSPRGLGVGGPEGRSDDLLVMADGGLLHLGGYVDEGPVVAHGAQSWLGSSIFGAVAALAGVLDKERGGDGGTYDVSAQECIAQALEDSAPGYALTGAVRQRLGERPREAGTGVYPCRDGHVSMVAGRLGTARAWRALVDWLNEAGAPGAEHLREERWGDFAFRQSPAGVDGFAAVFLPFAAQHDKAELYREAQSRMIALSPVSTVADLRENPQLLHRRFFVHVPGPDGELVFPGPPYRLSGSPVRPAAPVVEEPTAAWRTPLVRVGGADG